MPRRRRRALPAPKSRRHLPLPYQPHPQLPPPTWVLKAGRGTAPPCHSPAHRRAP
jgi:hypothetical protein